MAGSGFFFWRVFFFGGVMDATQFSIFRASKQAKMGLLQAEGPKTGRRPSQQAICSNLVFSSSV